MKPAPIPVIYIMGQSRSGSTVFEHVLATSVGAAALGEMKYRTTISLEDDALCSCGEALATCPIWAREVRENPAKTRGFIPFHRRRALLDMIRNPSAYRHFLIREYAVLRRLNAKLEGRILIDSSKDGLRLMQLRHLHRTGRITLVCIDMFRDPRASIWSYMQPWGDKDLAAGKQYAWHGTTVGRSTGQWVYNRVEQSILGLLGNIRPIRLSYRGFCGDPHGSVTSVRAKLAQAFGPEALIHDTPQTHQVAGGRARVNAADSYNTLTENVIWRAQMPRRDRAIATIVTAPWLILDRRR